MIARKIWLALSVVPRQNPIFQFAVKSNTDQLSLPVIRLITFAMGILICSTLCLLSTSAFITWAFVAAVGGIPLTLGFILILSTTVDGSLWAMRVADGIAMHRRKRHWDLLAVTPSGPTGVTWSLCRATFHRWGLLRRGLRSLKWAIGVIIAVLGLLLVPTFLASNQSRFQPVYIQILIQMGAMLGLLYVDYIHGMSCAALAGILGAQLAGRRTESQLAGYFIFQIVQFGVYTLPIAAITLIFQIQPMRTLINTWETETQAFTTLALVALVVLTREASCRILWHLSCRQLDEDDCLPPALPLD
ncbi:MAG: hypothetical protein KC547_12185 [Anaerolineae bacterium]|nr:hypothetical protein [Anaerolineae bacterium]